MIETLPTARKRFLVTGGAGFIGSALVRKLIAEGLGRVLNVDLLTYAGNLESLAESRTHPEHRFVQADVCDGPRLRILLEQFAPDTVIHLAAESHVDRSIDGPGRFVHTNLVGTYTLLQETLRYWRGLTRERGAGFRFLHVSTDEVFGTLGTEGLFTETTPYRPNSPYAATKAGADHLVRAWHATYGLPILLTNCSNNYGPYQFPEKLIPLTIQRALRQESLAVYGSGANVRDWLFVEDHVDALLAVVDRGGVGESYNISGRNEWPNLAVVQRICGILDEWRPTPDGRPHDRLITFVPDRPGHDLRYAIDPAKVEREIGWRPRESFESGLRRTVRWYLDNAGWLERVQSGAYRGERLGLGGVA